MAIDTKVKDYINKNAEVSIGTDGLVGNKVLNILPVQERAPLAVEGDLLVTKKSTDTEEMLKTLSNTNENIAYVSQELKITVQRLNNSRALWSLLNDSTLTPSVRNSLGNIQRASARANEFINGLNDLVAGIKKGEGSLGALIADTGFVQNLNEAVNKIQLVGSNANSLVSNLNELAEGIQKDIDKGSGAANLVLKDSAFAGHINKSLQNIEKATETFNQNLEALKHNILFRGYFRKLEKQKKAS